MKALLVCAVGLVLLGISMQTGTSSELASAPDPPGELFSFGRLRAGHTLVVDFTTQGCFHYDRSELRFDGGTPLMVTVTSIDEDWDKTKERMVETGRTLLGTLELSAEDARGLDSVISFYQAMPEGGCTTVDTVTITHLYGERVLANAGFYDETCQTHHMKGITTFGDIVWRLRKK